MLVKAAFWIPLALCTLAAFKSDPSGVAATLSGVAAHAVAFAYLAIALFAAYYRSGTVLPVALWLLAFGVMIEVGQTFIDGRRGELLDILVDAVGIVLGCVAYHVWLRQRAPAVSRTP